jgi:hypothetical protein
MAMFSWADQQKGEKCYEKSYLSHVGHILRKFPSAVARRGTNFRESLLIYCHRRAIYNAKTKSFGGACEDFDDWPLGCA